MVILIMEMNGFFPFLIWKLAAGSCQEEIQNALYVKPTEIGMKFIT
ncbi:hypothetical protein [Cytobacillus oceanisediminis]